MSVETEAAQSIQFEDGTTWFLNRAVKGNQQLGQNTEK